MSKLSAAVVGLGYWGPNLARNLAASGDFTLAALCDVDAKRLDAVGAHYPAALRFTDVDELLRVTRPDLVCVATPVATHCALAEKALASGSHVLVEKPLATNARECRTLLDAARAADRQLFVDHTFLFTGAVQEIQRRANDGSMGTLQYIDGVRINLGLFQSDVDVIWDLAPHDLAILQAVVGRPPLAVSAMAGVHNPRGLADVAYLHLDYGDELTGHLHLSWLSPVKVRRMIFAGTRQSIIYDDLEPTEKVKIYDHGVEFDVTDEEARRRVLVSYRKGEMRAPYLAVGEALTLELANVARALRGEERARAPAEDGAAVVRVLEAARRSLQSGGARVAVDDGVGQP